MLPGQAEALGMASAMHDMMEQGDRAKRGREPGDDIDDCHLPRSYIPPVQPQPHEEPGVQVHSHQQAALVPTFDPAQPSGVGPLYTKEIGPYCGELAWRGNPNTFPSESQSYWQQHFAQSFPTGPPAFPPSQLPPGIGAWGVATYPRRSRQISYLNIKAS